MSGHRVCILVGRCRITFHIMYFSPYTVCCILLATRMTLGRVCNHIAPIQCSLWDIQYWDISDEYACVRSSDLCNGKVDCYWGEDEWNCKNCQDNGGFICNESEHTPCIPFAFSPAAGDTIWDCPNQEDVSEYTLRNSMPGYVGMCQHITELYLCLCLYILFFQG